MVTVPPPTSAPPDTSTYINGGLFWREDEALKAYLKGKNIVTYDQTSEPGGRKVALYFRFTETEVRRRTYPLITIDRIGWERDSEREMRGPFYLSSDDPYVPDGVTPGDGKDYKSQDLPIPITIQYQITAWTRFKEQMMWVENRMSMEIFPPRFGAINMITSRHARDDDTVRRMDFLGSTVLDVIDSENPGKRLFGRAWTIGISSEMLQSALERAVGIPVERVLVDPSDRSGYNSVTE